MLALFSNYYLILVHLQIFSSIKYTKACRNFVSFTNFRNAYFAQRQLHPGRLKIMSSSNDHILDADTLLCYSTRIFISIVNHFKQ